MKYWRNINNLKGFMLVELLVVMGMMGLVIAAIYSSFLDTKRTSVTSEEVVDVQQNLRVAFEVLVADLRMAGFLIPDSATAITSAPDVIGVDVDGDGDVVDDGGAFFTLQTSSATRTYARVTDESFASPDVTLEVDAGIIDRFEAGDNIRVIRPSTSADLTGVWSIDGVDTANNQVTVIDNTYGPGTIEAGDMVVQKFAGEGSPTVINYYLRPTPGGGTNNFELMREVEGIATPSVIASLISAMDLIYVLNDGSEVATTTAFDEVKAIRISISAERDNQKAASANYTGPKTRRLQTLVKIRNSQGA